MGYDPSTKLKDDESNDEPTWFQKAAVVFLGAVLFAGVMLGSLVVGLLLYAMSQAGATGASLSAVLMTVKWPFQTMSNAEGIFILCMMLSHVGCTAVGTTLFLAGRKWIQ